MRRSAAEMISELALRVSGNLNSILIELLEDADPEKAAEYKRLIGSLLGQIYFGILRPVYELYPDLTPDELKTNR